MPNPDTLLSAATTTQSSIYERINTSTPVSSGARVEGTGAVTATVVVEASYDGVNVHATLGTITLSGTTSASDSMAIMCPYPFIRHRLSAISGTSAAVTSFLGV